ncbi:MAG: MerR family transcriptional regulator [Ilumatobacteraceae bacterium]
MAIQADLKSRANVAPDDTLSIGEVATAAGVATSTIRYYEERGLVTPVGRTSGRRRFAPSAVRRLWLIDLCTQAGFSLDECLTLLDDRGDDRAASRALGERKLLDIDDRIERLAVARQLVEFGLACTCPSLENCSCSADLTHAVDLPGLE